MMRLLMGFVFCLYIGSTHAQLINPASDWFESTSFFNKGFVQEKRINDIHILIKDKGDGKIIKDEGVFLHYEFNQAGDLKRSMKGIKLARGMDTAVVEFYYSNNHIIRQREQQGKLSYTTIYEFENDLPKRMTKIDDNVNPKDTLYSRWLNSEERDGKLIINTLNNSGKPYIKEEREYKNDTLIWQHISHVFNLSFTERKYIYEDGVLLKYSYTTYFDKKKEAFWEYTYENGLLAEAILFEDGERSKRRVFLYDDDLPSSLVERDYKEKSIRIYSFMYYFRDKL